MNSNDNNKAFNLITNIFAFIIITSAVYSIFFGLPTTFMIVALRVIVIFLFGFALHIKIEDKIKEQSKKLFNI